jgi:hypothetical protein
MAGRLESIPCRPEVTGWTTIGRDGLGVAGADRMDVQAMEAGREDTRRNRLDGHRGVSVGEVDSDGELAACEHPLMMATGVTSRATTAGRCLFMVSPHPPSSPANSECAGDGSRIVGLELRVRSRLAPRHIALPPPRHPPWRERFGGGAPHTIGPARRLTRRRSAAAWLCLLMRCQVSMDLQDDPAPPRCEAPRCEEASERAASTRRWAIRHPASIFTTTP